MCPQYFYSNKKITIIYDTYEVFLLESLRDGFAIFIFAFYFFYFIVFVFRAKATDRTMN